MVGIAIRKKQNDRKRSYFIVPGSVASRFYVNLYVDTIVRGRAALMYFWGLATVIMHVIIRMRWLVRVAIYIYSLYTRAMS